MGANPAYFVVIKYHIIIRGRKGFLFVATVW